jgi:hypothetical protein
MTRKSQETLRKKNLTVLADKGYYSGEDIKETETLGATPVVARQLKPGEKDGHRFSLDKFVYDKGKDEYTCPEGKVLHAHSKSKTKDRKFFNKPACKECPFNSECTGKNKYRSIVRKKGNDILDRADLRHKENEDLYKLRQQIVEHPFGTIKRTMNGGYYLLRSIEKVKTETSLLLLGYNIKRTIGYMGFEKMMELMGEWEALIKGLFTLIKSIRRFSWVYGANSIVRTT